MLLLASSWQPRRNSSNSGHAAASDAEKCMRPRHPQAGTYQAQLQRRLRLIRIFSIVSHTAAPSDISCSKSSHHCLHSLAWLVMDVASMDAQQGRISPHAASIRSSMPRLTCRYPNPVLRRSVHLRTVSRPVKFKASLVHCRRRQQQLQSLKPTSRRRLDRHHGCHVVGRSVRMAEPKPPEGVASACHRQRFAVHQSRTNRQLCGRSCGWGSTN